MVHDHARDALLSRFAYLNIAPELVIDLGCGTGGGLDALTRMFPQAEVIGLDINAAMCRESRARASSRATIVRADACRLPVADARVGVLFANLLMPWCSPERFFREVARTLVDGGVLLFSTLGPDTLREVRAAWREVDDSVHVHAFFDMHDLGDLAALAGLAEPVVDLERLTISYETVEALVRDLRHAGAINTAAGRRRGLTGQGRWRRFAESLESRAVDGRFGVTIELVYGNAWGRGAPFARRDLEGGVASVPVTEIGRR
jgi:malonyl-CoA O-methyltransferase